MRILMVSGEYPPMKGGVGRYTSNLVQALRKRGMDVIVATGDRGNSANLCNYQYLSENYGESKHDKDKMKNGKTNSIYSNVLWKGDYENASRLLDLVDQLKPDIINVQYERGLYEDDINIKQMAKRILYGSTLHKFFLNSPVPVVSTLHTIMPHNEYKNYIRERAKRKEGRFHRLPLPLRTLIRKWALEHRYGLLMEITKTSRHVICPAETIRDTIGRGTVIYHGAEPYPGVSETNYKEYRKVLGLPIDKRLLLAFGYVGSYKGFEILNGITMPDNWSLVVKQNKHERGTEQPIHVDNALHLSIDHVDDLTLSKLFFACDAIIFPYKIVSVSGILFDGLTHGMPFVASNLSFFSEFSGKGLGITCRRETKAFGEAIRDLAQHYDQYKSRVSEFKKRLLWNTVAQEHVNLFQQIIRDQEG